MEPATRRIKCEEEIDELERCFNDWDAEGVVMQMKKRDLVDFHIDGVDIFTLAAGRGDIKMVTALCDIGYPYIPYYSIKAAIKNDHYPVVEYLIGRRNVGSLSFFLRVAISYGRVDAIKLLLDCGVNPRRYDFYRYRDVVTPLGDALSRGRDDIAKILVIAGAHMDISVATEGYTFPSAIAYYIAAGYHELLEDLIDISGPPYLQCVSIATDVYSDRDRDFMLSLKVLSRRGIQIPISPVEYIDGLGGKKATFIFGEFWRDLHPNLRFENNTTLADAIARACATAFPDTDIGMNAHYYCTRDRVALTKTLVLARESPASPFHKWVFPVELLKIILEMCFLFVLPGEWKTK